jgi:hypothetical protein
VVRAEGDETKDEDGDEEPSGVVPTNPIRNEGALGTDDDDQVVSEVDGGDDDDDDVNDGDKEE